MACRSNEWVQERHLSNWNRLNVLNSVNIYRKALRYDTLNCDIKNTVYKQTWNMQKTEMEKFVQETKGAEN